MMHKEEAERTFFPTFSLSMALNNGYSSRLLLLLTCLLLGAQLVGAPSCVPYVDYYDPRCQLPGM